MRMFQKDIADTFAGVTKPVDRAESIPPGPMVAQSAAVDSPADRGTPGFSRHPITEPDEPGTRQYRSNQAATPAERVTMSA
jgi:hypothetical protein